MKSFSHSNYFQYVRKMALWQLPFNNDYLLFFSLNSHHFPFVLNHMYVNYLNKLNGSKENFTCLTRLIKRVDSFQHFITYCSMTLKTEIKIGTNNLLHVQFTFYGSFKLATKNFLIATYNMHMVFQMSFKWWVKLKTIVSNHRDSKLGWKIY